MRQSRRHGIHRALLVCLGLAGASAPILPGAFADMPGDVPDHVRLDLGGMSSASSTQAAVGSTTTGIGATINFEDIFDIPEGDDVLRFAGSWHFAKRQYIDFGYVEINRGGSREIQEDIDWGDFVFEAGGRVAATFKADFPYLAWRWDFLQLDEVRISGSAGIDYLGLAATLEAEGNVTDQEGNAVSGKVSEEGSVRFPVPQLGLQVDWALTRRLMVKMYSRFMYVDFADARGSIRESAIRLYWYFSKHVGIAGGIEQERIDLKEYVSGDSKAQFEYDVSGLTLYLATAF
jgi:hypothetical protein